MDGYKRFGLYIVPEGAFYRAGACWLGWDSAAGAQTVQQIGRASCRERVSFTV